MNIKVCHDVKSLGFYFDMLQKYLVVNIPTVIEENSEIRETVKSE